jgi:hypothetical protein
MLLKIGMKGDIEVNSNKEEVYVSVVHTFVKIYALYPNLQIDLVRSTCHSELL